MNATEIRECADLALETPVLNTNPLPDYDYDRLDYGMTIGCERTPGGRIWACWVGGGDNDKGFFVLSTSDDEGESWSKPRLVIDPHRPEHPHARRTLVGNLWTDPSGKLWLFFDQAMTYFEGRAGLWVTTCENPDADNPAWSTPRRIWDGCALNKPIIRSNGEWLLISSIWDRGRNQPPFKESFPELDSLRMANLLVSTDQGATWTRRGGVRFEGPSFDESHVIERKDGSLWITTRTNHGLYESVSTDGGTTWAQPTPSKIAHISSRHHLRRLASGRLLLVKHGVRIDEAPGERSHLTAFLSEDEGHTWQGGLLLDERATISYPDGFQSPDGTLFVSYDYNRDSHGEILLARFTEEDVLAGKLVNPKSRLRSLISRPLGIKSVCP